MTDIIPFDDWEQLARQCPYDIADEDPYTEKLHDLHTQVARLGRKVAPRQRKAIEAFAAGTPAATIAERLGYSSPGYIKSLVYSNRATQAYLKALYRLQYHQQGPTIDQRVGLLWRIALDNEAVKPTASIAAVDAINKMTGIYHEQAARYNQLPQQTGITLNLVNYNDLLQPPQQQQQQQQQQQPPNPVIDGSLSDD